MEELDKFSLEELKSKAFDNMRAIELLQEKQRIIYSEIIKKEGKKDEHNKTAN